MAKKKTAKKTAKQTELQGIEAPSHPELDTLMEEHAEVSATMGVCGGGFRWGEYPVSTSWSGGGPRWFSSEAHTHHMKCQGGVQEGS